MQWLISVLMLLQVTSSFASIKDENKVIDCAINIMETNRVNKDIVMKLETILVDLKTSNPQVLKKECRTLKKFSNKLDKMKTEDISILLTVENETDQDKITAKKFLNEVLTQTYDCKLHGLKAAGGALLMLGGGINAGLCKSSLAKNYLVIAPEFFIGAGLGAMAIAQTSKFKLKNKQVVHDMDGTQFIIALGYGGSFNMQGSGDQTGHALGLGFGIGTSHMLVFKMLPLKRNFAVVRKMLEMDDSRF